jgi:hypothetical protein
LIPDIGTTFKGIGEALKPKGMFTFQSCNIDSNDRNPDVLMIDDTVARVHDLALEIVRKESAFASYRQGLDERIAEQEQQRKLVFPQPRQLDFYLQKIKDAGFSLVDVKKVQTRFPYKDWMNFLRVKRLQAGILPEIGGVEPTIKEIHDRDELIRRAATQLFEELRANNKQADDIGFFAWNVHVIAQKVR